MIDKCRIRTEYPSDKKHDIWIGASAEDESPLLVVELKYYWDQFNDATFRADIDKLRDSEGERFFVVAFQKDPDHIEELGKQVKDAGIELLFWIWKESSLGWLKGKFVSWPGNG